MSTPFPIPSRYRGTLGVKEDDHNRQALVAARQVMEKFLPRSERFDEKTSLVYVRGESWPERGVLLLGPTGTGKSTVLGAMATYFEDQGIRTAWVSWGEMCSVAVDYTRRDHLDLLRNVPAMIVDDFAQVEPSVPVKGAVADLLECRYRNLLPLLAATNTLAEPDLARVLGVAVVSRLEQMCERVPVRGPDRRKGGGKHG